MVVEGAGTMADDVVVDLVMRLSRELLPGVTQVRDSRRAVEGESVVVRDRQHTSQTPSEAEILNKIISGSAGGRIRGDLQMNS